MRLGEVYHFRECRVWQVKPARLETVPITLLNVRVNRYDLEGIKHKARKLGVKYQTFLSEVIHRVAHSEL